jgi:uracil-DNA glycosylase family 4
MMITPSPTAAEIEAGGAYYGRAGNALMKSFKRLGIDPMAVYGTLCAKCPVADPSLVAEDCVARLAEEMAIVAPRVMVVMGEPALQALNRVDVPLARPLEPRLGEVQPLTPTVDALFTPDIDECLDEESSKREFWASFRVLGDWYAELPPY